MDSLTETEELFLLNLENFPTTKAAAEATGISPAHGYSLAKKLKDQIIDRARDNLAAASLRASTTAISMMDADAKQRMTLKVPYGTFITLYGLKKPPRSPYELKGYTQHLWKEVIRASFRRNLR